MIDRLLVGCIELGTYVQLTDTSTNTPAVLWLVECERLRWSQTSGESTDTSRKTVVMSVIIPFNYYWTYWIII